MPLETKQLDRLDVLRLEVRSRHPEFKEASVERLARSLYQIEQDAETEDEGNYEKDWNLRKQKERLLDRRSAPNVFSLQQEHRVEELCEKILADNPSLRQKVAKETANTSDRNSIDYCDPDNYGRSKLHQAAYDGNVAECRRLVDAGANTEIMDEHGKTAFMIAVREENIPCADYLKDK